MKHRELGLRVSRPVSRITDALKPVVNIRAPTKRQAVKASRKLASNFKRLSFKWKLACLVPAAILVLVLSLVFWGRPDYSLTAPARLVIGDTNKSILSELKFSSKSNSFVLNQKGISNAGSTLGSSLAVGGSNTRGAYSAMLPKNISKGITIYDDTSDLSFSMTPNISLYSAKDVNGHVVYPGHNGLQAVYTLLGNGLKEDLVLNHKVSNDATYSYSLKLPSYLEAKENGSNSIGIYSADSALFGKISYGSSASEAAVLKARIKSPKNNLVFELLAPVVNESDGKLNGKASDVRTTLTLKGNTVIVSVIGLDNLTYPISIDPSVLVTSASLTNGNNEGDASLSGGELSEAGLDGGSLSAGWSSTSSLATGTFSATSVAYNGYIYEIGGNTSSGIISSVYYASISGNGSLGSWGSTTSLSSATDDATAVAYNGYVYEIGGYTTTFTPNVYYAQIGSNGALGTWTSTTSLSAGTDFSTSVVYNGYIYEIGGDGSSGISDYVYYAKIGSNGALGTWTSTTILPEDTYQATSVAYNGYIYEIGGDTSSLTPNVYYAQIGSNGALGTWTATTSLTNATDGASSVVYNGYIYEIGGNINSGPNASTYYAVVNSNGTLGAWTTTSSFGSVSYGQTAIAYNGYIYMIGGTTGTTSQDYSYTGSGTTFTVPAGVTSINVDMSGGAGGTGNSTVVTENIYDPNPDECDCDIYGAYNAGGSGGNGTRVQGVISVSPEEQLSIYVAGAGGVGSNGSHGGSGGYGYGYGGGGNGSGDGGNDGASGGGGGSSAITSGGSALAVAGGGGGGGGGSYEWIDETFSNGQEDGEAGCYGGSGGANSAGGTGTNSCSVSGGGLNWSLYDGNGGSLGGSGSATGQTGQADGNSEYGEGGGGGGGYLGGSLGYAGTGAGDCLENADDSFNCDGSGGGGGAGSSLVPSNGSATSGYESGNGYIDISYGTDYNAVLYAPIDPAGITGAYSTTTPLSQPLYAAASEAYNGYLYELGGYNSTGGYQTTVYYAPISSNGTIGSWGTTTPLSEGLYGATSAIYNGYIYELGGLYNGTYQTTVYYAAISSNGTIGSWGTTTQITQAVDYATTVVYNGYIYELGGYTSSGSIGNVYYAAIGSSGTLGSWSSATSLQLPTYGAASVVYGGYIYEIGGSNTTGSQQPTVYYAPISSNGSLGSWSSTTYPSDASVSLIYLTAVVQSGYIYVISGDSNGSWQSATYYAPINSNGSLGSWSLGTNLGQGLSQATAAVYNGYVYELGGWNSSGVWQSTVYYAQINNGGPGTLSSWTATTGLLAATQNLASVAYNGYLYEIGGYAGGITATVDYAPISSNGALGSWTATTSLLTATEYIDAVAYNGYLYEIGGYAGSSSTATVDYAPISPTTGALGSWTPTTGLLSATYAGSSVAYNGYVYEIGGIAGTRTVTVDYAPISPTTGALGSWAATTGLPTATQSADSIVYNGYLYEIGGSTSSGSTTAVYYAPISSNGQLGSWTATTGLLGATYQATAVAYNGYVYEMGGNDNGITSASEYAPINSNGTLGTWTATTSLLAVTQNFASVAYNGYVYEIGGNTGSNTATVDYAGLQSIPRIAYYSTLLDLSGSSSKDPTPTELITYGTNPGNPGIGGTSGLGTGGTLVSYSLASNGCSTLTSPANILSSTELNTAYPINNQATNGCSNGSNNFRYVWVRYELDDSETATFPDINGNHTTITGFQVYYEPASSGRLRGGETFNSSGPQSLYAPPTTGAP